MPSSRTVSATPSSRLHHDLHTIANRHWATAVTIADSVGRSLPTSRTAATTPGKLLGKLPPPSSRPRRRLGHAVVTPTPSYRPPYRPRRHRGSCIVTNGLLNLPVVWIIQDGIAHPILVVVRPAAMVPVQTIKSKRSS
jgi:hypothetical protein